MQYKTLFDINAKGFEWWPTLALISFGVALLLATRSMRSKESPNRKLFTFSMAALCFLSALGVFAMMRLDFHNAQREFTARNFETVEGQVQDFRPMPRKGGAYESFTVKGVTFSYSDYESSPGFNHTSSHGGPIREGLPVRITYIHDSEHSPERNIILKLEVAQSTTK